MTDTRPMWVPEWLPARRGGSPRLKLLREEQRGPQGRLDPSSGRARGEQGCGDLELNCWEVKLLVKTGPALGSMAGQQSRTQPMDRPRSSPSSQARPTGQLVAAPGLRRRCWQTSTPSLH